MSSPLFFITAVQRLVKFCTPVRTPSLLLCLISRGNSYATPGPSHGVVSSILGTSQSLVGSCQDCTAGGEALHGKRFRSIEEVSNEVTREIRRINNEGVVTGI
jgi:hypothetical protein